MATINSGDEALHETTKVKKDNGESKGYQLPQSTEAQDDLDLEQRVPKNIKEQEQDQLDEELTYG